MARFSDLTLPNNKTYDIGQSTGAEFIRGTWTAATNAWTGVTTDSELYDHKEIVLFLPFAGNSSATTLNLTLKGGGTTGAKAVYFNSTTRHTTHYGQYQMVRMVYHKSLDIGGTNYEGWWIDYARDTNTTYTAATAAPGNVASTGAVGTSTNYARQDHTHGIALATGDNNGQVKIAGTNVSVKGLGTAAYTASTAYLAASLKGAKSGVAELDANGFVPSSQLPSYVDDVLEYDKKASFPSTGETGKIYVALDTNIIYRWSGSAYVEISSSLALGTTSSTAFRGDYGNAAYAHAVTNKGAAFAAGLYKITTNAEGHVTAATAVTKADITALGIPGSDTNTWTAMKGATSSADGGAGYVPAPSKTNYNTAYLRADGTWSVPPNSNTTYSAGVGMALSSTTFKTNLRSETKLTNDSAAATETAGRIYPVVLDKSGYLAVNVPWVDTNTQTITGVKGNAESSYRTGNVNLTPANIGAKAVQTAVSDPTASGNSITFISTISQNTQGVITPTKATVSTMGAASASAAGSVGLVPAPAKGDQEKFLRADGTWQTPTNTTYSSKAAANGGTDVSLVTTGEKYTWNNKSNLTIGTTATTAAAGNHTHTLSLAADSGTSAITLAANTKYKITAGGSTYIFTTPPDTNTNNAVAQTITTGNADYRVLFSVTADDTTRTEGARKASNLKFNPSTGNLTVTKINGVDVGSAPKFTDSDTHYTTHLYAGSGTAANAATTNGNTKITLTDNTTVRNSVTIKGTGGTTVTSDANGVISINSAATEKFLTFDTDTETVSLA